MRVTEASFQRSVIDQARLCGWWVMHVSDSRREVIDGGVSRLVGDSLVKGWPDLTLVHPRKRRVMFRELKTNRASLTPEQKDWLRVLRAAGADVDVWRPRDHERITTELTQRKEPT